MQYNVLVPYYELALVLYLHESLQVH